MGSDCKVLEYCHDIWNICLPIKTITVPAPTKLPPWYCHTSKDCKINEKCHKSFHVCYKRPGMSTSTQVTTSAGQCKDSSDCAATFVCHDHFHICIQDKQVVAKLLSTKQCSLNFPCPKHQSQQCQNDSDCRPYEFCGAKNLGHAVTRHETSVQKICLPLKSRQKQLKKDKVIRCKNDTDCGLNKCCLEDVGICMEYKQLGEICFTSKVRFENFLHHD